MEKVWAELKKIEAQAEQIRSEADGKSKEITRTAEQEADKLLANAKAYAEEDAQQMREAAVKEADQSHTQKLQTNKESAKQLKLKAETRMDKASDAIVQAVLGETKDAAARKVR